MKQNFLNTLTLLTVYSLFYAGYYWILKLIIITEPIASRQNWKKLEPTYTSRGREKHPNHLLEPKTRCRWTVGQQLVWNEKNVWRPHLLQLRKKKFWSMIAWNWTVGCWSRWRRTWSREPLKTSRCKVYLKRKPLYHLDPGTKGIP